MKRAFYPAIAVFAALLALPCVSGIASEKQSGASLAEALEDWVRLLEKDDAKAAAGRWARDPEAAKVMEERWSQLKQCHKDYDYRKWLDKDPATGGAGARGIGDATKFTVGGHSYGHVHVSWVRVDAGWRIGDVWLCR